MEVFFQSLQVERQWKAVKELVDVTGGHGTNMGEGLGFQTLSLGFRAPGCWFLTSHAAWRGFFGCSEF